MKIAFDCNILASVLLGGVTRDHFIKIISSDKNIKIFHCNELIDEVKKLSSVKYFQKKGITEAVISKFIQSFQANSRQINLKSSFTENRDQKDNYLLSLSFDAHLNYLITGDNDLLIMQSFHDTKILTIKDFIEIL